MKTCAICGKEIDGGVVVESECLEKLKKATEQIKSIYETLDDAEKSRKIIKNYTELAVSNGLALGRIASITEYKFKEGK